MKVGINKTVATLLAAVPTILAAGSGLKSDGEAGTGFDNKFFLFDSTLASTEADPNIGIAPTQTHYISKITYCANDDGFIDSLQLDMTNGIDGSLIPGTAHDPLNKIADGDTSCETKDITKYQCFRKAEIFADAAKDPTYLSSIKLTDSTGQVVSFPGGLADEVSYKSYDFGAKGCLAGYDFWFDSVAAGADKIRIEYGNLIWEKNTVLFEDTVCTGKEKDGIAKTFNYELPESDPEAKSLFAADQFYEITANRPNRIAADCVQTFAITQTIAGLTVDENTGKLDYSLESTAKGQSTVIVEVLTKNTKTGQEDKKATSLTIDTKCGKASTTISIDALSRVSRFQDNTEDLISDVTRYKSSNNLCPITDFDMATDADSAKFTRTGDVANGWKVQMDKAEAALVQTPTWTGILKAEGDATFDVKQEVEIKPACRSEPSSNLQKLHTKFLPVTGTTAEEKFPASKDDLVTLSSGIPSVCFYDFSLTYQNNTPVDAAAFSIDSSTGQITLKTSYDTFVDEVLKITVVTKGSYRDDTIYLENIAVKVVCGKDSTVIEVPPLTEQTQYAYTIPTRDPSKPKPAYTSDWIPGEPISQTGAFKSTNELCPLTTIIMTSDDTAIKFTRLNNTDIKIDLKSAKLTEYGIYPYTIQATAEGGNTVDVTQQIEIKRVCQSDTIDSFDSVKAKFTTDLPENGEDTYTFPSSADLYVQPARQGCVHQFTYTMEDGSANPEELKLDDRTGIFTLTTQKTRKRSYKVAIKVTTFGQGENDPVLTITGVQVETKCGPNSANVIVPTITDFTKTTKIKRLDDYGNTGKFTSSNSACPIQYQDIFEGKTDFVFTNLTNGDFKVILNSATSAHKVGDYQFKLEAYAEGGALGYATGNVKVTEQICTNVLVPGPTQAFDYDLPVGTVDNTVVDNATRYINWPEEGCIQKFDYELENGQKVDELTVDPVMGVVKLETAATRKLVYKFSLIITTTEAPEPVVTKIPGWTITINCGKSSTAVINPTNFEPMIRMADLAGKPEIKSEFKSQNALCPIELVELKDTAPEITLTHTAGDFSVFLSATKSSVLGVYPFTVYARAEGGAENEFSSNYEIKEAARTVADNEITAEDGAKLNVFRIGDKDAPITNKFEGDGLNVIQGIKLCRKDSDSKVISGIQFTLVSTISMRITEKAVEGYKGTDCSQEIELAGDDCFQRFDLLFNSDGDAVQIGYKRRKGSDEEFIGYDKGLQVQSAVDFGKTGCLSGYRLAFQDVQSNRRLLQDKPQTLKSAAVVANVDVTSDLTNANDANKKADFVSEADGQKKSELLYGKTGYFDWIKKRPISSIKTGFADDFLFVGFTATFGTGQVAEPHSLGEPCKTNCKEVNLGPNDCITTVNVAGKDHVRRLRIETKLGIQYDIGSQENGLQTWDTATNKGECMTGIWGVYQSTGNTDEKGLMAIGFYFESGKTKVLGNTGNPVSSTQPTSTAQTTTNSDSENKTDDSIVQTSMIVLVILAIGILVCSGIVIYLCFKQQPNQIVVEGEPELENGKIIAVRSNSISPRRTAKINDMENILGKGETPSMLALHPDVQSDLRKSAETIPGYKLSMRDFLVECDLEKKYILKFKRQGIDTVDDFMALDAGDLAVLDIEEDDLATILILIQNQKDREEDPNALTHANTLQELLIEGSLEKYYINFEANGVRNIRAFAGLTEKDLAKFNIKSQDFNKLMEKIDVAKALIKELDDASR